MRRQRKHGPGAVSGRLGLQQSNEDGLLLPLDDCAEKSEAYRRGGAEGGRALWCQHVRSSPNLPPIPIGLAPYLQSLLTATPRRASRPRPPSPRLLPPSPGCPAPCPAPQHVCPPPPLASTASGRRCASIFDSWTLVEGRGQDEEEKNLEKDGKKKKKVRKVSDKEKAIRDAVTTHEVFHKLAVINIATEDGDKLWGGVEGRRGRAVQTRRGLRTSVRIARWVQILTVGQCVV